MVTKNKNKPFYQELLETEISFSKSYMFKDKAKEKFYSELSLLYSSGIHITQALEIIKSEYKINSFECKVFESLLSTLRKGEQLSTALQQAKAGFTDYEIYNISIGQETGKLAEILKELALYFNRKLKLQRQLMSALSYPIIIVVTTIIVILILMNFVVPVFADIFRQMDKPLPPMTKLVIEMSNFITDYILILLLIPLVLLIVYQKEKEKEWFRKTMAQLSLKLPIFNEIIQKTYLARMCQSFSLLLSSQINTSEAVQLVSKMVSFYPIELALKQVAKDLEKGSTFHECFAKHKIFPARLVSLIKVGEEVSKIEEIFSKVSQQYTEEVEYKSSVISTLLEPFIITIVGVIVAFILIALYQPMFDFSTNIVN